MVLHPIIIVAYKKKEIPLKNQLLCEELFIVKINKVRKKQKLHIVASSHIAATFFYLSIKLVAHIAVQLFFLSI